ncbi:NADH-quinone oxidoreductase subunit NuoG [Thiococcus pfennigii]|uniref:NADH-quinone oxidoreductase subunit NuoG n=1 Tax=Thiococcus pfennigii TaxID=1057 RepID=UPI001905298E|nr:NADH-quinone oxidoreductase subunit NuoG [Thiococcus pfennigii]MBK1732255.1 NADH-quinone oxidoreductase subunit G [Thiococcus pfennigii]
MTDKVTIEIDGRTCEAQPGEMIIAAADREGIVIPRFCYHKKLSIAANCRMCLVEVEQNGRPFPKPLPACATPIAAGMRVQTRSAKALEAQRGTMEFLLINHPLDCPICDQGGECELQDVAMGYGDDLSRYSEGKRVVLDEDLGPLIATDMTRCIHCTRCVRFGAEIAGVRELGATGRGEDMRIGTYVGHTVAHELSGNVIDLCPVGALTAKPSRFQARAWELRTVPGVAPHDALGANIELHVRRGRVIRIHPRDNEAVNETWLADRDRFSYAGLYSDDRLCEPMVKRDGEWHPLPWADALRLAATGLAARAQSDAAAVGLLMSPSATLEEMYLAQKLMRALGVANLDHRLRQQDCRSDAADPALPWLGVPIAEVERQAALLLIGTDLRQEQPLLAHRVRKAALAGASVTLVNPYRLDLTFANRQFVADPAAMLLELAAIAKALGGAAKEAGGAVADLIGMAKANAGHKETAKQLRAAGKQGAGLILLGALAAAHPDYSLLKALAYRIATASGARVGFLPAGANGVGAHLAGLVPHRGPGGAPLAAPGLAAAAMLAAPRRAYLLWGLEPDRDLADPAQAQRALAGAELVVAATSFRTPALEALADILLPIAAFAETSGTFVNAAGTWQGFAGAVVPPGEARPGWKVLRVLGNELGLAGFEQTSSAEVLAELRAAGGEATPDNAPAGDPEAIAPVPAPVSAERPDLWRIGNLPIYAIDPLVRRAPALRHTPLGEGLAVRLHPEEAAARGLADGDAVLVAQGEARATSRVVLDAAVARGCARIPSGVPGSESLGASIAPVTLEKV